jgi:protein involved in polysaccharide export with SLBB domain
MLNNRSVTLSILTVFFLSCFLCSQSNQPIRADARTAVSRSDRNQPVELSELAKDNLQHVAASSIQIREVLVKDAGLLVELKRWVAKEATDNGQIVEDSDLSDQAIFDRLDHDVAFRSVATILVQRYGYLRPSPNPESSLAKEEDLVLKERARQLVQIEAQEDAQALTANKSNAEQNEDKEKELERTSDCGPQDQDPSCNQRRNRRRMEEREEENEMQPVPDPGSSFSPDMLRTLRTDFSDGMSSPGMSSMGMSSMGMSSLLGAGLGSASMKSSDDSLLLRSMQPRIDGQSANPLDLQAFLDHGSSFDSATTGISDSDIRARSPHMNWKRGTTGEEDVSPVKMVRPANPYADIPSLYDMYVQASASQRPVERFGLDVFRNSINDEDVIPMDIPVGPEYVVGPGDSLSINLWGSVSQRFVRRVDREGRVPLPDTAPLLVSGKSLEEVQLDVQHALRSVFRDVSADVSVSRLRTVRVYVLGEVAEPGAYDISSLSTPLNALIAAGGITPRGSLRKLQHFRGNQMIEEVDAYELLLHGVRSDLKRLETGDTLRVPPVGPQVTIEGMVRRPAVYELLSEASLAETLELAGGVLPTAALRHIEVQRVEAHEKRTMLTLDLTSDDSQSVAQQLAGFKVQDGDQVHIFPIAAYNEDAIYLQGHVLRPGRYSYKQGMKLTDLIASYGDLLPEPAPHYGEIVRLNPPDFHPTVESFDVSAALANPASAPALKPLDTVRIFSRYDFEAPPQVSVIGEVRKPGTYRTSGQAHLRDALYLAGGITPTAALDTAQLFRSESDGTMKILSVNLGEALSGNPVDNIILQPRDRLLIHRSLESVDAPTIDIRGEVAKPGRYPLTSNMRIEDLVRTAGGLKRSAFAETADLTRFVATSGTNQHVEIKLASALSGDPNDNLPLKNGDVLSVGRIPQWNDLSASVAVKGEVQHPATYGIGPGERLSSVLARSGGFTSQAFPYGAVLIRQEVRELEMRAHLELVDRLKAEQTYLQGLPDGDGVQRNAKLTAVAQADTALRQLEATAPLGRVVIHIPSDPRRLANTSADVALRDGDVLIIPKKSNFVMVSGQVYNPTAVSYEPGKSARWYLSQSGGVTQLADKSAAFVIRADGSVLAAKNNSGFWSGDPMTAVLKPGDSIVVPERAAKIGARDWTPILQAAQVASSLALTVAYIHP